MSAHDWNTHYADDFQPWDTGVPDAHLVALVGTGTIATGRALEIGCGTGTNALWLAAQGFEVVGVDVAPLAIDKARAKAAAAGGVARCRFQVLDFLAERPEGGRFDFVFDRGCFHVFDEAETRARFADGVADLLAPGGRWLSLIGSTEGPPLDIGPPRRSAADVVTAIEPALEIVELRSLLFETRLESPSAAWACLSRRRHVPAQPSARR